MNLKELEIALSGESSKQKVKVVAQVIYKDEKSVKSLVGLMLAEQKAISARAAWVFQELVNIQCKYVSKHYTTLIHHLKKSKPENVRL